MTLKPPQVTFYHSLLPEGVGKEILLPFEEKGKVSNQDGMSPPKDKTDSISKHSWSARNLGEKRGVTPVSALEDIMI